MKTVFTFTLCYPEPEGEFFNQSKTIIGGALRASNDTEGCRTTEVILVTD
jgi:hypothetical protein